MNILNKSFHLLVSIVDGKMNFDSLGKIHFSYQKHTRARSRLEFCMEELNSIVKSESISSSEADIKAQWLSTLLHILRSWLQMGTKVFLEKWRIHSSVSEWWILKEICKYLKYKTENIRCWKNISQLEQFTWFWCFRQWWIVFLLIS